MDRRGRDRMVVGLTTICTISAYHHLICEFEPRSWQSVFDTTILSVNHANNNLNTRQNAFSRHRMDSSLWFKRMELIEVKSLIWAQKGKLYIIYETVVWILGILRFKSIHLLFYTFIHIIHMYITNDSNVILKYFHFVFLVVFF